MWNANYVDHVQITMAEDIGIAGRAGYYDGIGAARDVIQNHLLQLLALTAMEEPVSFDAKDLRAEKEKVLSAVRLPADLDKGAARGQYAAGWQGAEEVVGYLDEEGVDPKSVTETFAAVTLEVDTRRWAGVPFYLRTGKRLGKRVTEIAVVFKRAPHLPFEHTATEELGQNAIVIRVQPDEGVTIRFGSKVPGAQMEVRDVTMDFGYGSSFTEASPEAYERLILDVLSAIRRSSPDTRRSSRPGGSSTPHEALGQVRQAGAVSRRDVGTALGRPDARTRRTYVEDAVIRDLTDTTTTGISKTLVRLRNEVGALALGRVLTLVVVVEDTDAGNAIEVANQASRQHPAASSSSSPATAAARTAWTPRSASAVTPERARSSCCGSTAPWPTTAPASSCRCCCPTPRSSPGGPARPRPTSPRIPSAQWPNVASPTWPSTGTPASC